MRDTCASKSVQPAVSLDYRTAQGNSEEAQRQRKHPASPIVMVRPERFELPTT